MTHHSTTVYVTVPLEVSWDYQPYEPPERGPEAQYPGCNEAAEINKVCVGEVDVTDALDEDTLEVIADVVLEELRNDEPTDYDYSRALDGNE